MYEQYYALTADPFSSIPDLNFSYKSRSYTKAWSRIEYALSCEEGLVVTTGLPGVGKTTLAHNLLAFVRSNQELVTLIHKESWGRGDLLWLVTSLFGLKGNIDRPAVSLLQLKQLLTDGTAPRQTVCVIIDEAHNLSDVTLNEIRALLNLHNDGHSLLQIFLVGRDHLWDLFHAPEMGDLRQRMIAVLKLEPLGVDETESYIMHRLHRVGWNQDPRIDGEVFPIIHKVTQGIPRLMNVFCERLLQHGYRNRRHGLGIEDASLAIKKLQEEGLIIGELNSTLILKTPPTAISSNSMEEAASQNISKLSHRNEIRNRKARSRHGVPGQATITPISHSQISKEKPMNRSESLDKVLKTLQQGSPDVEAVALISEDGLTIASVLPHDFDETRIGGMSATLLSLGTRAATELRRGEIHEVIIRGEGGYAVLIDVGRGVLLLAVANEKAKLGMIFFDMREAIGAIKQIL